MSYDTDFPSIVAECKTTPLQGAWEDRELLKDFVVVENDGEGG